MPPKRSNPSGSAEERPAKKAATGAAKAGAAKAGAAKAGAGKAGAGKAGASKAGASKTGAGKAGAGKAGAAKAPTPRLKKSTPPNWDEPEKYSQDRPKGKWAAKCVEQWYLLPPYDTSITEAQWKTYYLERSALDKVNTSGSDESMMIVCEELTQDTGDTLRWMSGDVAAAIFGSTLDDEHKKRIGRTLLGSLYFTELSGTGEGDGSPREVRAMSRLYSPFGLGTSIDLFYSYYVRMRDGQFASLYVNANTIASCDAKNPRRCKAIKPSDRGEDKVVQGAITVFDRDGKKSKSTTAANLKSFEESLFGCEGWLSPLKLIHILFAAAGVMSFLEDDNKGPESTLAKFQFFQGESDGKDLLKQELAKLAELEKEAGGDVDEYGYEDGVCVPQRLLLLAREDLEESEDESE